jgi:hypothetical protein
VGRTDDDAEHGGSSSSSSPEKGRTQSNTHTPYRCRAPSASCPTWLICTLRGAGAAASGLPARDLLMICIGDTRRRREAR